MRRLHRNGTQLRYAGSAYSIPYQYSHTHGNHSAYKYHCAKQHSHTNEHCCTHKYAYSYQYRSADSDAGGSHRDPDTHKY